MPTFLIDAHASSRQVVPDLVEVQRGKGAESLAKQSGVNLTYVGIVTSTSNFAGHLASRRVSQHVLKQARHQHEHIVNDACVVLPMGPILHLPTQLPGSIPEAVYDGAKLPSSRGRFGNQPTILHQRERASV
eukprot:6490970-Amphidinium_carterae.1